MAIASLVVKEKFGKKSKSLQILRNLLSGKFYFAFHVLITAKIFKNSRIKARIFLIFLGNVVKQTWNCLNTKFTPQWKDRKSSYQVTQNLGEFLPLKCSNFRLRQCEKPLELTKNHNI